MTYDVIIIGAGPGGIFTAYELLEKTDGLKIAVFELGNPLEKRKCPIDNVKIKNCVPHHKEDFASFSQCFPLSKSGFLPCSRLDMQSYPQT